jgi:hypothetical protein
MQTIGKAKQTIDSAKQTINEEERRGSNFQVQEFFRVYLYCMFCITLRN